MSAQRLPLIHERMWLLSQLTPRDPIYNLALAVEAPAGLDERVLSGALAAVVAEHDCLRMSFHETESGPVAALAPAAETTLVLESIATRTRAEEERAISEVVARPFELRRAPLLRAGCIHRRDRTDLLVFVVHHLIWDGSSWTVFADALDRAFRADGARAEPGSTSYAGYLREQRDAFEHGALDADIDYWRSRLLHAPPVTIGDQGHGAGPACRYEHAPLHADALGPLVDRLAAQAGVTPFMVCATALLTLIARYTSEYDVSLSVPVSRRIKPELQDVLGCLIGFVTIRARLDPGMSFLDALGRVRAACHEAYVRADVPSELDVHRSAVPAAVLSFRSTPRAEFRLAGSTLRPAGGYAPAGLHELSVDLAIRDGSVTGAVGVAESVVQTGLAPGDVAGHLLRIIRSGVEREGRLRLDEMHCLGASDRARLLSWSAGPRLALPASSVIELVQASVAAHGRSVAVVSGEASLTLGELDQRANALARVLVAQGVGIGDFVGVCLERGIDAVMALLGVLKAGAAFVPLDPEYPRDRLELMVEDSGSRVVVDRREGLDWVPDGVATLSVEDLPSAADSGPVDVAVGPADAAFALYTSGSTGRPKGVVHTHRAIVSRILGDPWPLRAGERCPHKTSLSFVDSIWEVFAPLTTGGVCVVIDEQTVRDPRKLVAELAGHGAHRIMLVPSLLRALLESDLDLEAELPELRLWLSGGEPLTRQLVERFRAQLPHARLVNVYGASECWDAAWWDCVAAEPDPVSVPIGRPLPGMHAYILAEQLEPVPPGVAGELCVTGPTVARGYVGRPELTAERFVPNPFGASDGPLYRTGDLARWRRDRTIAYLGRRDGQVKVRGFRVEPGEVEAALLAQPVVRRAAVVAKPRGDQTELVAYVVPTHADDPASDETLRAALAQTLPRHMLPAAFVHIKELPLTPHGKLDPSRLPEARRRPDGPRARPTTAAEELLTRIWAEALDVESEQIGTSDDFFELGGDSLRAQAATTAIRRATKREVGIALLFQAPTVAEMAARLDDLPSASAGPSPGAAERRPLTSDPAG